MEIINVLMKKILQNEAGSFKKKMPSSTVQTAPMPVQIGYAVPIGSVCTALANNIMLSASDTINPASHR